MPAQFIEFNREDDDCLWVVLLQGSTDFREPLALAEGQALTEAIERDQILKVVVDMSLLPYFGSTVLEWLVTFWKKLRERGGVLVLFGPTPVGRDVLRVVRFDAIWPIAETREEALQMVRELFENPVEK